LFQKVCRGLVEHGGFRIAWIGWLDDDGVTLKRVASWGDKTDYLQSIDVRIDHAPEGHGPSGTAFREQRTYVCNDVRADPGTAPWRAQMYQHGIRASAAIPVRLQDKVCGTLTVYASDPGFFHSKETALLEEAAHDISFALDVFVSEDRRRAAEAALSKSEASLAAAQSRARIGNWEIELVSGAVTWSAEMFRIFGREPQHDAPSMKKVIELIHPDDRETFQAKHESSVTEGKGHRQFFRVVHPDGTVCWIEGIADFIKDEQGWPVLMVGTAQDVTAMKRANDEISQLNATLEQKVAARTAELQAANKELEAFSYSVSHDLRAPLRAINGFTGIVLKDFAQDMPEAGRNYLDRIRNGGERMGQLIDDLLSFSRLSRQPISDSAVEELKPQMEGREIDLRIGDLPSCHGDANLLKQAWINLIANAVKYTRGRSRAVIEIGCAQESGEPVYFVRDNGAGFDMKYAGKLFGVFQRLHRASEFEGTGVGLAIVQRVIHRHGGRIWATAGKNRGATFSFTLQTQGSP
jgi:PAS domain S-box-containing protein